MILDAEEYNSNINLCDSIDISNIDISDSLANKYITETNISDEYRGWKNKIEPYFLFNHHEVKLDIYAINLNNYKEYITNKYSIAKILIFLSGFCKNNFHSIFTIQSWRVDIPELYSVTKKDEQYIIFGIFYHPFTHYDVKQLENEFSVTLNKWNPFKKTQYKIFYKRLLSLKCNYRKYMIENITNKEDYLISYYKNQINERQNYDLTIRQFLTLWKCKKSIESFSNDEIDHIANVLNHYSFNDYLYTDNFHHYPTYIIWKESKQNSDLEKSLFVPITFFTTKDELQKIEDKYDNILNEENNNKLILEDSSVQENNNEETLPEENAHINENILENDVSNLNLMDSQVFIPNNLSYNGLWYIGEWKSNSYYDIGDVIKNNEYNVFFLCVTAHLSSSFIVDYLVENYWEQIIDETGINYIKTQQQFVEKNKQHKRQKKEKKKKSRKVFIFDEHK